MAMTQRIRYGYGWTDPRGVFGNTEKDCIINGYAYISSVWNWNGTVQWSSPDKPDVVPLGDTGEWVLTFRIICDGVLISTHTDKDEAERLCELVNKQRRIERGQ